MTKRKSKHDDDKNNGDIKTMLNVETKMLRQWWWRDIEEEDDDKDDDDKYSDGKNTKIVMNH